MLLLLLCCAAEAARAATVSCFFKNAAPGDKVEVYVPHFYLDGKSGSYTGTLDGQLQCRIEVCVPKAQVAFVVFSDDRLPIFLEPEDTLLLRSDAFQFPLAVHFGGRSGANNALLLQYFREFPHDWDEFNNLRLKVGQYWAPIEEPLNRLMEDLPVDSFRRRRDALRVAAYALYEAFGNEHPDALTPAFEDWMEADVLYTWAHALLFYGQVYGGRHFVQPEFFDFLYEAPIIGEQLGCDVYRQFLMLLMARQQLKQGKSADNFYAGQYALAGDLLDGEAQAFVRSELITFGFWGERYREMLPCYNDFVQHNRFPAYDEKVQGLYSRISRVAPGSSAPAFRVKDAAGHTVSLEGLRGKVVYLNFWASWCAACIRKMEILDPYVPELHSQGIEVLNISIDQNPISWQASIEKHGFRGTHLLSTETDNIAAAYQVEAVPQYFIIGRDGKFLEKAASNQPDDIRQRLMESR
ncbi:MAG TPA: TlpA disulfide reductase family protein [Saprospiraceae bacterium]|nr:TlpA disulfide reductase family protein [Saprospiraceae bacterium]